MRDSKPIALLFAAAVALAACAQQEEIAGPVAMEPTFDKYGAGSCRPSGEPISSTFPARIPPCDPGDCVGGYVPGTADVPCVPPPPQREDREPEPSSRPTAG